MCALPIRPPALPGLTIKPHRRPMTAGQAERRGQREIAHGAFRRQYCLCSAACLHPRRKRSPRRRLQRMLAVGESCQESDRDLQTSKSAGECRSRSSGGTPQPNRSAALPATSEVTGVIHEDETSFIYVAAGSLVSGQSRDLRNTCRAGSPSVWRNGKRRCAGPLRHKQGLPGMACNVFLPNRGRNDACTLASPPLIEVLRFLGGQMARLNKMAACRCKRRRTQRDGLRDLDPGQGGVALKTMFEAIACWMRLATLHPVRSAVRSDVTPTISWCSPDGRPSVSMGFGAAPPHGPQHHDR
jgi:hypothetical protein